MALGYDGKLYILAFDHRGSFQKKMFGIEGDPTEEETKTISDAKKLIFEGMQKAVERGVDASSAGVLVDEQFGSDIPELAGEHGLSLTMPVEKSGQTSSTSSTATSSATTSRSTTCWPPRCSSVTTRTATRR